MSLSKSTVAIQAFLHYLPQFAERAGFPDETISTQIAKIHQNVPSGLRETVADSCSNHLIEQIIKIADKIACGVNKNDAIAQGQDGCLMTLFEQMDIADNHVPHAQSLKWVYPLKPLSAENIFPVEKKESMSENCDQLWTMFAEGLHDIPQSHRQNFHLWLDHFDTLWQNCTQSIPFIKQSGTISDISLYDHSRTVAALAVALFQWHKEEGLVDDEAIENLSESKDWDFNKILLIQGDFSGIQNFIFASGSQTNQQAAKLLRGRSFQVSLFAQLAALKILQNCQLPPTSQVLDAAGKFMIVAPNTPKILEALKDIRKEMNTWFLEHTYGQVSLGLAVQEASCRDFADQDQFTALLKRSFEVLEIAKLQRFQLTEEETPIILPAQYNHLKACIYNEKVPAQLKDNKTAKGVAKLSCDQITIGNLLTRYNRIMILREDANIRNANDTKQLELTIFGFQVAFTVEQEITGQFGAQAKDQTLIRCWDFSLPQLHEENIWQGYARRYINAYIPRFASDDEYLSDKYRTANIDDDSLDVQSGNLKTFNYIACEERKEINDQYRGKIALATLKGDVDNLGTIFQQGLRNPSFAKMAALSRQMSHFFSLWLPAYCQKYYPNTYTVFAGGDDFFLIGPWLKMQSLVADMRQKFADYVANNAHISFSAGIAITKPNLPLPKLSAYAEEALDKAKAYPNQAQTKEKNAVCLYGEVVSWKKWPLLQAASNEISRLTEDYAISSGYLYRILQFTDMQKAAQQGDISASMWRSLFAYRTRRHINQQKHILPNAKNNAYQQLLMGFSTNGIDQLGSDFRIPLFNHFYQLRER